jgi:outer membrane biosynthesis protein TonB
VTGAEFHDQSLPEKLILRALILSLVIHCLAFFVYRMGESEGWWTHWRMPRWMQIVSRVLAPEIPKKVAIAPPRLVPLTFVEVDPVKALQEPPKNPKFEGAHNTVAANPEIVKPSDMPDIQGKQTKYLKTVEKARPKTVAAQPTPPPQPAATPAAMKKAYTPGDLASARPAEKAQEKDKTGADTATDAQPQPPVHQRPRTLAEARERYGTPGDMTRQTGGVHRIEGSSLDVKGSVLGGYEAQMFNAIEAKWDQLLVNVTPNVFGKVVLEYDLHPNGSVTNIKVTRNEVNDELMWYCNQAVSSTQPYGEWPRQLRMDYPDPVRIQITFYYDVE